MTWDFGDGFDLYTTTADATLGYWDTGTTTSAFALAAGRYSGSRCITNNSPGLWLAKSSGIHDAVHHLVVAVQVTNLSGSVLSNYLQLLDGTTGQCCVVFRSDGAILLTSGTPTGTVLASYAGAISAVNTWYGFEFEITINNSTGRFRARRNGSISDDFDSGAIDTQVSGNAYANKLQVGMNASPTGSQRFDDLYWRSHATSVSWMGDLRCFTRMPVSDASVMFTRGIAFVSQSLNIPTFIYNAITLGHSRYIQFVARYSGPVSAGTWDANVSMTGSGNVRCAIFANTSNAPGAVLATSNQIVSPVPGLNPITFPAPATLVAGQTYWFGYAASSNTISAGVNNISGAGSLNLTTVAYGSFPQSSPSTAGSTSSVNQWGFSITIDTSINAEMCAEAQQDGASTYVAAATAGDADLYTVAGITATPANTIAVTTRGFVQKTDAGARAAAMQLKSGSTTVASTTAGSLNPGAWTWLYRTDLTDPNTGVAWTPVAVNSVQIGPLVVS